ncbi:MAG: phenylacetate--CoA ligase family protein [Burkholderiaceae bacterium]|nr:phenylacetate--CoA ligase family protein [Burkholderiaceae bacterium]
MNRSLYTRLVSGVIFPLQERLKRHDTVAVRRSLERSQWWPAQRLREYQIDRLRTLLVEAGRAVPYYRDLFERIGFEPRQVCSVEDLRRLPFLDKATIRSHTEALKHPEARGLARFNTGGSSGQPLVFFIGRERVSHDVAAKWRATRWWGVDIGDPEIVVWGSPIELGAQDRVRQLRDTAMRTELLPAFDMSESNLDAMVRKVRRRRPRMLFGYPSALSRLARHAQRRGQSMNDLGIRVAFCTSERLYDDQRATISQVFGCRVANGYGGRDAGFVAHECPHGGMHITAEDIVVELIDRDGVPAAEGQPGEVVVTHLATSEFPFIRYRTGDVAVLGARRCPCGRGLPLLEEIQGRTTDFVYAADGTAMHALALIYILRDLPGLDSFKIVQHDLLHVCVQLVPGPGFDPACAEVIRCGFHQRLGEGVRVQIDRVAAIEPERSGKFRYVVSHVAAS